MFVISRDNVVIYSFDEKPVFEGGVLRYPVYALDIKEGTVDVSEVDTLDGFTIPPQPLPPFEVFRDQKIKYVKESFLRHSEKPIVDTGLGFKVDGSYQNKQDFEVGKKYAFPQVRASDNTMHDVTASDYDTIIQAIEMNGIALYQHKWDLEASIEQATTILDLEAITW